MTRYSLFVLAALCLPGCTQSSAANAELAAVSTLDEAVERDAILNKVQTAIAAKDYAALSAMESDFRLSRARTPSGLWKLAVFHAGVQAYLADGLQSVAGCQYRKKQFVQQWAAASPANPAPVITDAALLLAQGWCHRGSGYANSVAPHAWAQFRESVAAASQRLEAHAKAASVDPEYYAIKVEVLRGKGARLDAVHDLLEEATAREPYYHRTYFNAAWSFLPQWGGSYAEVERFARYAADKTRSREQDGFYARLFWSLEECGCDIIERAADRAKLKQAMRDAYNLYPVRWNGQYFADVSCRLGEGEEGRRFLRAIHPEATGEGDFAALFASCDGAAEASS